jgi:predicted MPP superfamily phosphohydrolase
MKRFLSIAPFLLIFSALLFVCNWVVYAALAAMLGVSSAFWLLVLGVLLGVLSASLIASTILGSYFYNFFTRWYYRISAMWVGFFAYLFFASVIYGLVVLATGSRVPQIGMALVALAAAISAYGFVHARRILVTEVSVVLPNLPAAWAARRAVFISDIHLGQLHGPAFARRVVRAVNSVPHDIIFIGGDLYDGTGAPDIDELTAPLRGFKAALGTYFITGNHEEYGDSGRFLTAVRGAGITTLVDESVVVEGVQIIGVDYRHASTREGFATILAGLGIQKERPSILLKHEPKDLDIARDAGVSLQLSGHTHLGQMWPFGLLAQRMYKGFAYGLRPLGSLLIYTSSGVGTWGPPMRVGTRSEVVVITFSRQKSPNAILAT